MPGTGAPATFTPDPAQLSDRSTWHDQFGDEESLERLRAICLPYPEAMEDGGVGSPSYKVRAKIFAMRHPMRLPTGDRPSVWMKLGPASNRCWSDRRRSASGCRRISAIGDGSRSTSTVTPTGTNSRT